MHVCVSYRLICQCVIRVSCYENYTRNTQTALVCTLLPVSYMLRCACWTLVCTKLCRRGQDVEHHRRARCDGSSAPCSGGPQISPHSCAAGAEGPLIFSATDPDTVRSGNMPFSHFWPAVVSSLLASVQFELLLPSFLARAHRPKGIDCPVTSEPGR